MKKFLAVLLSIAIILGAIELFNQYQVKQGKIELERITAFNDGYTNHVLAAAASDDILVVKAEIDKAMDYLYTLAFDKKHVSKDDIDGILDWYTGKLATRGVVRDILERGGLGDEDNWMLKDLITDEFLIDGKVAVPDKLWMKTIQTNDKESDEIFGALAPDVTEGLFGDSFGDTPVSQLSIETPLPGARVFSI